MLSFLLSFSLVVFVAPAANAQLFADEAARDHARVNASDIETIKSLLRDMQQAIDSGEQSLEGQIQTLQQQNTVLRQKSQALEEKVRALTGRLEEFQQQSASAGDKIAGDIRAGMQLQEKRAQQERETLFQTIDELTAEVEDLKTQIALVDQMVAPKPEDELYTASHAKYKQKDLDGAISGFNKTLQLYPNGQFSPNAYHWLVQAYFDKGDYQLALDSAQKMLEQHSQNARAPGVMLLAAEALINLEQRTEAEVYLRRIIEEHPTSLAADSAREKIAQ